MARQAQPQGGGSLDTPSADTQRPLSSSAATGSALSALDVEGQQRILSRRRIFKRAVGVAAVGAAGGSLLAQASPASAAATTTEPGAVAPAVVSLTDAATIAVDASLGNDFRVTIAANRTMGNPANPTDGQKITFQVTQGAGGSATITWGSSYEFSDGLPQPTLSTKAGQTDLLGFIYNAAKGKWLLAAFVNGFSSDDVTQPQGTYRLFPSTNGPSSPVSYSGPFMAGVLFEVTTGRYVVRRLLVVGVPVGAVHVGTEVRALVRVQRRRLGTLIPAATVTSGALTAGQWNYVPLATPIPLAIGACYNACTGFSDSFPDTTEPVRRRRDPTAPGSSTGRCRRSPTSPDRCRLPSICLRACSAWPDRIPRRSCRATGTSPTTSGWTSRSKPKRPPGLLTGCGRTTRTCRAPLNGGRGLHPGDGVHLVAVLHAGQHLVLLRRPARARCRLGARSGMCLRRAWFQEPTTPRRLGRDRRAAAGSRARTTA